jgi:hypothetical protein
MRRLITFPGLSISLALLLAGCSSQKTEYSYPNTSMPNGSNDFYAKKDGLFGDDGVNVFGNSSKNDEGNGGGNTGVAVNTFLWRASLDTISFLPLVSADPFGGVIITDWYVDPATPYERVKMQVYILDRQLRSDGLRVAVFLQRLNNGQWQAQPVSKRTAETIEDSILTRARELRIKSAA